MTCCKKCGYPIDTNPVILDGEEYHDQCLTGDERRNIRRSNAKGHAHVTEYNQLVKNSSNDANEKDSSSSGIGSAFLSELLPWIPFACAAFVIGAFDIEAGSGRWLLIALAGCTGTAFSAISFVNRYTTVQVATSIIGAIAAISMYTG